MNRKVIALTGTLVLGCVTVTLCAPYTQTSTAAVNSQKEFDKTFGEINDAKSLNLVGHAYDNQNARLFWFTDLEAAKRQAKAENKPILSLRLLGNLSEEYSCANSRLFRVLLYPNKQINPLLRDKFILHWSSERPVPVVTIDFGDGKKMKQTLTGNSAHYLLDASGRPLDVLPGLHSPQAFETWLKEGEKLAANWNAESGETREQTLRKWHEERISTIWSEQVRSGGNEKWVRDQTESSLRENPLSPTKPNNNSSKVIPARTATIATAAKRMMEAPLLNATNLFSASSRVSGWIWGDATNGNVKLDDETIARIKAMNPRVDKSFMLTNTDGNPYLLTQAQPVSAPAAKPEPFDLLIKNLEQSVSVDTAANKYRMEIPIHALFAKGEEGNFETLNRKIYDTLFMTPKSDPYLGLGSDGVFTGLQNGGILQSAPQQ